MLNLFDLEKVHEYKKLQLKEEMERDDIDILYDKERNEMEKEAIIKKFIPLLVYKRLKERFTNEI